VIHGGVETEDPDVTRYRAPVALEGLDGRRLPGAVRAEEHEYLSGFGGEVEIVDGGGRPGRPIAHGKAPDLDGWHDVAGYFGSK
jgi:hypothetical protein